MKRLDITIQNKLNPVENQSFIIGVDNNVTPDNVIDSLLNLNENEARIGRVFNNLDTTVTVDVESEFVRKIRYNFSNNIMQVILETGNYNYPDTTLQTFLAFISASSKGYFFNKYLRKPRV